MDNFISRILEELEKRGVSQTWLAKESGFSQVKVNRLLNGTTKRPDWKMVLRLCEVLGIDAESAQKEKPQVPEHLRLLHAEIDRVAMNGRTAAEQYELTAKILRILQEEIRDGQTR